MFWFWDEVKGNRGVGRTRNVPSGPAFSSPAFSSPNPIPLLRQLSRELLGRRKVRCRMVGLWKTDRPCARGFRPVFAVILR